MAQLVYSGIQGSGKSYEVVSGVIVPAVRDGRRVVTNVAGLKTDRIRAYVLQEFGVDFAKQGSIVPITNDDVTKANFFPIEGSDNNDSIVQGGDIVILDECWRWYASGEKLDKAHLTFFRMHRHFTHPETGQCCDIVLIVQDIGDLVRKVRATVEKSFLMKKHKELGFPDRYVVSIYSGRNQNARAFIEDYQKSYDPAIFSLYSSYSQSKAVGAQEKSADVRGNVFNRPIIKYGIPISVLLLLGAIYFVWKFFHPNVKKPDPASPVALGAPATAPVTPAAPEHTGPEISKTWRLIGYYSHGTNTVFVMSDTAGRVRHISNPPGVKYSAGEVELALPSGEIVTAWSGTNMENKK